VVTGASGGIGAATARELAGRNFHVLAGVRRNVDADLVRERGIEPVILDIRTPDHIEDLVNRVADDSRPLRAVVNNAAMQINVPVETFPIDEWRKMFDTNLFGHVSVIQALLPALLQSKGRLVNISSVGGKVAMAAYGPYAAAKFALEAVSDSLRRELASFGVGVIVIEPGAVHTEMAGRAIDAARDQLATMTAEQRQRYASLVQAVIGQIAASTERALSPDAVAAVIATAVTARRPRTRYTVGRDAALIGRLVRVLPDRTLDHLLAAGLRRY
jgi:NAD(P)-dependent dehydrogenase (short-subunit alcohol dehydrogenase family)